MNKLNDDPNFRFAIKFASVIVHTMLAKDYTAVVGGLEEREQGSTEVTATLTEKAVSGSGCKFKFKMVGSHPWKMSNPCHAQLPSISNKASESYLWQLKNSLGESYKLKR